MHFFTVDIAWFDTGPKTIMRCGLPSWRIASVHFHYKIAHKPDVVRYTLQSFFSLMIRDTVRVISGDWNEAHRLLDEVLSSICTTGVEYQILHAEGGREIAFGLLNYPDEPELKAERRNAITGKDVNEMFGLSPTDNDCHKPLVVACFPGSVDLTKRSSLHSHSESAKKRKKAKERERCKRKKEATE